MTTGIIVGEDINGTISEYLTNNFNRTGTTGKRTGIGRSNKHGVSKAWNPDRDHNSRLERCNHQSPDRNTERANLSAHSRNNGRRHKNLNLKRENMEKGRMKKGTDRTGRIDRTDRTDGRMMNSLSR